MGAPILSTDPLDFLLDSTGDIVIDAQGLHWSYGVAGVAQLIRTTVLLFTGEWFRNLASGVPWFDVILGENYDERATYDALYAAILGVPGVDSITSLTITFDPFNRTLSMEYEVACSFGDTASNTLDLTQVLNAP